jgi:Mg2+ and Co2+ transporter CorA
MLTVYSSTNVGAISSADPDCVHALRDAVWLDLLRLFSVLAVVFLPPTLIASIME